MDYTEKTEKIQSPAVAIDGAKARTIREAKRLTQLYVASVVGVTTDTISRWENNRSPSIKRDNAEKLAYALEVELDHILRDEDQPPPTFELPDGSVATASPPHRRHRLAVWLVLLLAIATGAYVTLRPPPKPPIANRWLPAYAAPGTIVPVKMLILRPDNNSHGFIVKEHLPAGWKILTAAPAAVAAGQSPEAKWLVPAGTGTEAIIYTVQVPTSAVQNSLATFSGEVILHESGNAHTEKVLGNQQLRISGVHWADQNGDLRIDDTEIMPAYYLSEEFKNLGIEWKPIETIWNSRGYAWDASTRIVRPLP